MQSNNLHTIRLQVKVTHFFNIERVLRVGSSVGIGHVLLNEDKFLRVFIKNLEYKMK